jgi:phospholipid/cholesterol/gamma-HCH transport system substrate-binding protein
MESEARYALVGLAVLALAALLAMGFYWLRNSGEQQAVNRYTVYFRNQSLEGLQMNSDVRMQGIKVGKVVDYTILPSQAKTVKVILEVDARTPVLEGVEAVVTRNLVTGLAAVDLDNVWKGGTAYIEVLKGEEYPVIDEGVPQMTRFTNTLEDLGVASSEAMRRFNTLLSDPNQKAIAGALTNLDGLSGDLRQTVPELNATLAATRQAAVRLDELGAEVTRGVRDGDAVLRQMGGRLDRLAGEAEATLVATRDTLASTKTTLGRVDEEMRGLGASLRLTADLGLQEAQITALRLRLASEAVQETSRNLTDPGRILYGPHKAELGPGE